MSPPLLMVHAVSKKSYLKASFSVSAQTFVIKDCGSMNIEWICKMKVSEINTKSQESGYLIVESLYCIAIFKYLMKCEAIFRTPV